MFNYAKEHPEEIKNVSRILSIVHSIQMLILWIIPAHVKLQVVWLLHQVLNANTQVKSRV